MCARVICCLVVPIDCTPPGSSVHGIIPARTLKWLAISYFREVPDPGIVNPLGKLCTVGCVLTKYVISYIYHYNIIQSSFTALKTLFALHIHLSLPPPKCGNHPSLPVSFLLASSFTFNYSFVFSRLSCRWNHTVFSLFRVAAFICLFIFWRTSWLLSDLGSYK